MLNPDLLSCRQSLWSLSLHDQRKDLRGEGERWGSLVQVPVCDLSKDRGMRIWYLGVASCTCVDLAKELEPTGGTAAIYPNVVSIRCT